MSATTPTKRQRRASNYVPKEQRPLTRFYCNDCNHKFRSRLLANRNTNAVQHYCSLYKKIITRKINAHSNKCEGNHGTNACIIKRMESNSTEIESDDETKRAYYADQGKEYPSTKRKRYGMSSGVRRSQPRKKRQKYNNNINQYGHGIQPYSYPYGQTEYTPYHPSYYHPQSYHSSIVPSPVQLNHQSSAEHPPMPEFMDDQINGHANYNGCISPPSIVPCAIPNVQNRGRVLKQPEMNEHLPLPPPLEEFDDGGRVESKQTLEYIHEKSVSQQQLNEYPTKMMEAGEMIPMPLKNYEQSEMEDEKECTLQTSMVNGSCVENGGKQSGMKDEMNDEMKDDVSNDVNNHLVSDISNGDQNEVSLVINKNDEEDDEDCDLILDVPQ